jgi:hypothetical protein
MKTAYYLLRIACYLALPLYFRFRSVTPQPVKDMLSAFLAAVVIAEGILFFLRNRSLRTLVMMLPLLACLGALYPFRTMLHYFSGADQAVMAALACISILYYFDRKFLYPNVHS